MFLNKKEMTEGLKDFNKFYNHLILNDSKKAKEMADKSKEIDGYEIKFTVNGVELDLEKFDDYIKARFDERISKISNLEKEVERLANIKAKEKIENSIYSCFSALESIQNKLEYINEESEKVYYE